MLINKKEDKIFKIFLPKKTPIKMKFSIQKESLLKLLTEHSKVVPIRTTLPILSCAYLEVEKNRLLIKTTNLDQTIISTTKIKDEESGTVAIPMNKLLEIVSALPNEEIKIISNEDFLIEINNNQGTYKITGRSSEEFPEKNKTKTQKTISLPSLDFIDIINKTTYATSKDDLKPALTGVYFNIKEGQITAVSTDGHKLVKYEKEIMILSNKYRYLTDVMDEKLVIFRKKKTVIFENLEKRNYDKMNNSYDYLLNMPGYSFTKEKLEQLKKELDSKKKLLKDILSRTPKEMWNNDLDKLIKFLIS